MLTLTSRINFGELEKFAGATVTVVGWVDVLRRQKAMQFVILRDGMSRVQLVNERSGNPALAELIDGLHGEDTIVAQGTVQLNPRIKLGGLEIVLHDVEVLSRSQDLPIGTDAGPDARLDWRFIDLRSERNQLYARVATLVESEFRRFCLDAGLLEINSPKLMASPSESRSELFNVKYFETTAYLAQSPQFYKQMAISAGYPGVFETGPVFRANPSFTSRHDTEFTSLDVELPWIDSHHDVMNFEENLLSQILGSVAATYGDAISERYGTDVSVPLLPFPRVSHADAVEIVRESGYTIPRSDGDLDPEAERRLSAHILAKYGHEFVFVTDYPSSVRPFYHRRCEDDQNVTRSFDLLWKGVEVTTGAMREHRPDVLMRQATEKKLDVKELDHYLNFFKYGCPPHGGFGLGLTRILMLLLGTPNVREVTYVYRGPNRLTP
jgi:aspartyl-tRNA synthetase